MHSITSNSLNGIHAKSGERFFSTEIRGKRRRSNIESSNPTVRKTKEAYRNSPHHSSQSILLLSSPPNLALNRSEDSNFKHQPCPMPNANVALSFDAFTLPEPSISSPNKPPKTLRNRLDASPESGPYRIAHMSAINLRSPQFFSCDSNNFALSPLHTADVPLPYSPLQSSQNLLPSCVLLPSHVPLPNFPLQSQNLSPANVPLPDSPLQSSQNFLEGLSPEIARLPTATPDSPSRSLRKFSKLSLLDNSGKSTATNASHLRALTCLSILTKTNLVQKSSKECHNSCD